MKNILFCLLSGLLIIAAFGGCNTNTDPNIGVAVEFNTHAASVYLADSQEWFQEEGLKLNTIESYVTGMALAASLARGDIEVAYICLVPAINAYANAGIPLKVIAGTHEYGYGLTVNSDIIKNIEDLEKDGVRIGCVREGGAVDIIMQKTIAKYNLDKNKVLNNIQRMNPPKQVLSIHLGKLDAAFLPEHWATMAEVYGFTTLLNSQDIWPGIQGSVLVIKEDTLNSHHEIAQKLVKVTRKATDWINNNPDKASEIVAGQLNMIQETILPVEVAEPTAQLEITPEIIRRSFNRISYKNEINLNTTQEIIDYMAELGHIKEPFSADDILDLRYLQ